MSLKTDTSDTGKCVLLSLDKKEVESTDVNFTLALLWEVVIFSEQGLPKEFDKRVKFFSC